ncbi:hypothetical protein [Methylobacterium sp. A54F]
MEHFGSTLATTAVAALGLVAAAHILHPRDLVAEKPRARSVTVLVAEPAQASAWVDPPDASRASSQSPAPAPRPAAFTLITADMLALPTLPDASSQDRRPRAERARRHVPAQAALRQAEPRPVRTPGDAATAQPAAPDTRTGELPGDDPIGSLIRDLGLGAGREG